MPTGAEFVKLSLKRFLSQNRMSNELLDYLQEKFCDGIARIFPSQGLFVASDDLVLTNNGDGTFSMLPDPIDGTDGLGHIMRLTGTERMDDIPFENNGTDHYWIALHYIEIPSGVYTNPATGNVEYDKIAEEIGEVADPEAITDLGAGRIRLDVDSVFTHGEDNSRRWVRVYLTNPMSPDEAVAFEDLVVEYNGATGTNYVDTAGSLGQVTISTQTAAYKVAALGVCVQKGLTNPFGPEYAIIGYVIAGGTGSSIDDFVDLSGGGGHTLQRAYDGLAGDGSGREIAADAQAVLIRQENATIREHDIANSALRIMKDMSTAVYPATPPAEIGIDIMSHPSMPGSIIIRSPLCDMAGGDKLRVEETVNLLVGTARIDFTRGGSLDLLLTGNKGDLRGTRQDMVEISGSAQGQDGLYWLWSVVDLNTLELRNIDATTPSFVAETGLTARVYRPILMLGRLTGLLEVNTMAEFLEDGSPGSIQRGLSIDVPAGVTSANAVVDISRDGAGSIFSIDGDGKVEIHDDLDMNGNDIRLSTGDIVMGENPTDGGDIFMKDGNIVNAATVSITTGTGIGLSMGGKNIDNAGALDMDADGTGIDMNGTSIVDCGGITLSDGSITSYHNIDTVTGYIQAKTNVKAEINVEADSEGNGTGEFTYGADKTYHKILAAEDAVSDSGGQLVIGNLSTGGGMQTSYWQTTADAILSFPLSLPLSSVITQVQILYHQTSDNGVYGELLSLEEDWSTPASDSRSSLSGPTGSGAGTKTDTIDLTPGGGVTIAGDVKYLVMVRMVHAQAPIVYAVRVTFTMDTVKPPV